MCPIKKENTGRGNVNIRKYIKAMMEELNAEIDSFDEEFFQMLYDEIISYEGKHLKDYYMYLLLKILEHEESPRNDEEYLSETRSLINALIGIQHISSELKENKMP